VVLWAKKHRVDLGLLALGAFPRLLFLN